MSEGVQIEMNPRRAFWVPTKRGLWLILPSGFVLVALTTWGVVSALIFMTITEAIAIGAWYLVARFRHYVILHSAWLDVCLIMSLRIPYQNVLSVEVNESRGQLIVNRSRFFSRTVWPQDPEGAAGAIRRRVEAAKVAAPVETP